MQPGTPYEEEVDMAPDYLSGLLLFANLAPARDILARVNEPKVSDWTEGDGLRFCSLNTTPFASQLRKRVTDLSCGKLHEFAEAVDINLIEVTGFGRPHHHEESDVVLRCISQDPASSYVFSAPAGTKFWHPAQHGELIVLPRGTAHGFERRGRAAAPFRLVDFNYPPLGEADVVYRD